MEDNLPRIVIDTNVIISALVFGGNSKIIIEKLIKREFIAYTSPQLISELLEILLQKFNFSDEMIKKVEVQINSLSHVVYPTVEINIARDRDDNRVLEVAEESESSIIVTGDKDLLSLKVYKNIIIMNPKVFLEIIGN
ncbi:putative toxin-antitoxin system toxin component, PIN family [Candidatus Woesebacteria bacterium GWC2_33_12]|uniref:Toxin-antitoxin system toxin component, PIN family n=1 Tax=Candidatus Woesebacteria bacterium GW2011_GWB1_33_22 TaxID=1618566 RepID=A0A0G0A150_9BACT|nr:MAG: Toxin-antitoxin system toxin component, PIN family [Candidatus Woesebacteria bacterium GW2011_GWC2_33_12]KKP42212.1 MAG: Toxin-antitoxin system toxin component, PIN family [Candidatus Woesebacteria bacterium GW2011_GWA2_33_20]KKP44946.1 MAG: Toxin-antitoxin system toxin component, PIN family [Candidatus Woesebacteria bacterium GW2011_GWB1_33_22]KKP46760.1 MAG: Toxin-antitoxin system toxin component, PIN family [Microgenomates group bacterium GW2011_GWC1_33_28]KKP50660.1 MAG: Toxin-antit